MEPPRLLHIHEHVGSQARGHALIYSQNTMSCYSVNAGFWKKLRGGSAAAPLRMRSSLGPARMPVSLFWLIRRRGRRGGEHTSGSSNENTRNAEFFDVGAAGHDQGRVDRAGSLERSKSCQIPKSIIHFRLAFCPGHLVRFLIINKE